jgi:hypothetical protein
MNPMENRPLAWGSANVPGNTFMRQLLLLTLLSGVVHAADPPYEIGKPLGPQLACQSKWAWDQARANLPQMAQVIDMSSKGEEFDASVAKVIETGSSPALVSAAAGAMNLGATTPVSVAVAGPTVVLQPFLKRLEPELKGQRLPYLTVLFIGPVELEAQTRAFVEGHAARFLFIAYSEHKCDQDKAQ